jgi:hypothetical protein
MGFIDTGEEVGTDAFNADRIFTPDILALHGQMGAAVIRFIADIAFFHFGGGSLCR